ncbi:MAG TPA: AAA family ATPase [Firmicutes bacterium]|jgi:cell division protease FtsH|nr:AAA family ATPase [Bacillota bacterium]
MLKEVGVGVALGVIIGLVWLGFNVYPLLFFLGIFFLLYRVLDVRGGIKEFSSLKHNKNQASTAISFEDIGGQNIAKKELLEALDFIKIPEKIELMGIRPLKGILLAGPPGTGKTLLAKAAASYTDSVFVSAAGSEFIEMYAGVGAQRVRKIFQQARNLARKKNKQSAIIFIDEIEILGAKRGSHSSHLEYDQTLNQLLVEMDGLGTDDEIRVLLIGATNRADLLDSALMRPGRFDRIVQVELPDFEGRQQILKLHTRNKPLAKDVQLEAIAAETFGFSGAHLESLANEAAIAALREKSKYLERKHFNEAIDKVIMGEKLDRRPSEEEIRRIAIHEMGHALISEYITPCSISTITIVPRGKAMGYIRQRPEKDSYVHTKDYLEGQIAVLLGGAVSEEELLGSRSTGALNDFQQAVELAKKIISSGMSSLGVISSKDLPGGVLHKSIKEIISVQEERVRVIIIKYRDIIEQAAQYLLEKERISGKYLRELLSRDKKNEVGDENI